MGWRKTGKFFEPHEIQICVCDECGKDIGLPDGCGAHTHLDLSIDYEYPVEDGERWYICSAECLKKFSDRIKLH